MTDVEFAPSDPMFGSSDHDHAFPLATDWPGGSFSNPDFQNWYNIGGAFAQMGSSEPFGSVLPITMMQASLPISAVSMPALANPTMDGASSISAQLSARLFGGLAGNQASAFPAPHNIALASTASFQPVTTIQSGGLTINITYDSSVSSAPAAFKTEVAAAVSYLEGQFNDPVTLNIHVGFGEVNGSTISSGALGESNSFLIGVSYTDLKNALTADASTADDSTALASLPASDPTGGGNYFISIAEARALGLYTASDTQIDGYVGFDSTVGTFDYNNSDGVTAGQYDFYDVVLHELTEVMGRQLEVGGKIGSTTNSYEPLDLFHYSSAGTRDFSGTTPGYFSINGGTTNLKAFSTDTNGDFGDWAASAGNDAFLAFSGPGVVNGMSEADLKELDVLGWNRVSSGGTPDLTATSASLTGSTLSYHINNGGTGTAASSTAGIYLSADSTITTSDTLINTHATPSLAAAATDNESVSLTLPTALTPGTYYIGAIADYTNAVAESNEANNASSAIPIILGNDSANTFTGTAGNDKIFALGGNDTIYMYANLTAADQIDGGTGTDIVSFNGDYSLGLILGATTIVNVETFYFAPGHSYKLTTNDATVASGQTLTIGAGGLSATDTLTFNGAPETNGQFVVNGGAGNDAITTGAGNDTINAGAGNDVITPGTGNDTVSGGAGNDTIYMNANLTAADRIDGGTGTDIVSFNGDYSLGLILGATTIVNVETLYFAAGHSYKLTTNDATVASGQTLTIGAGGLSATDTLTFNGAPETNGQFVVNGGAGNDAITTGAGNDTINAGAGNDVITPGTGNDTVSGGAGNDTIYMNANLTAADRIDGGTGTDIVSFNGDYSLGLILGATTIVNVETLYFAAGHSYKLTTNDATVASGQTLTIGAGGLSATDTLTFNGSAETNGKFVINGGAGADIITGGNGADTITGGAGADTFVYGSATPSTSTNYDTLVGVNFSADRFDTPGGPGTVTAIDAVLSTGSLSTASFDSDLATALNGHLNAHHAELFTANAGTLSGQTFLIVDVNGTAGYQAGQDLVIHLTSQTGTLATTDFI